ncbi:hypothetical protein NST62_06870 [Ureibacillus sp. FSL K6-8385]|uniref:Uncharacterized protein n=1 Tax=Ureibacillus terrenus TaxID=118246 RepID=A0A540V197_9BACL|nr:hypothetical protein [Ureibacillus terrenus]MED3662687.1 hypothetical protein [Ureibacillus terrenus]TQE90532.1 hypothetical protein FKZ59_09675 [Ureibacillus terrenus]
MPQHSLRPILIGILICLIIIALKPSPEFDGSSTGQMELISPVDVSTGEKIVELGNNRLAIIDTNLNSGNHGQVLVVEFKEDEKSFEVIGKYNYLEDFENMEE